MAVGTSQWCAGVLHLNPGSQQSTALYATRKGILCGIVHKGMAAGGVHYVVAGVITVKTVSTLAHSIMKK